MKKTKEIIGLPIISIFDGTEIGMVKNIIINAEDRSISFVVVENGLHLLGAKVISTDRLLGIGEHAVTVEDDNVISMISKIPAAMDLLEKNVQIRGTKVLTKKGKLVGEITEIYVDEEDRCRIKGMDFLPLRGDGSGKFLPDKCIVTYGRHLVIISDAYESMLADLPDQSMRQHGAYKPESEQQFSLDADTTAGVFAADAPDAPGSLVSPAFSAPAFVAPAPAAPEISAKIPDSAGGAGYTQFQPVAGAAIAGIEPLERVEKKNLDILTDRQPLAAGEAPDSSIARKADPAAQAAAIPQAGVAVQAGVATQSGAAMQSGTALRADPAIQTAVSEQADLSIQPIFAGQADQAVQAAVAEQADLAKQSVMAGQADPYMQAAMSGQAEPTIQAGVILQTGIAARAVDVPPAETAMREGAALGTFESPIQAESPIQTESPVQAESRVPYESPIYAESPIPIETSIQMDTPIQIVSPVQTESQMPYESPAAFVPPVQAESYVQAESPIKAAIPVPAESLIQIESPAAFVSPVQTETPVQAESAMQAESPVQEESAIQAEMPVLVESPMQVDTPISFESPMQAEMPVQAESAMQAESPVQAESPMQVDSPISFESPMQEEIPVQAESSMQAESPVQAESPMQAESPISFESPLPVAPPAPGVSPAPIGETARAAAPVPVETIISPKTETVSAPDIIPLTEDSSPAAPLSARAVPDEAIAPEAAAIADVSAAAPPIYSDAVSAYAGAEAALLEETAPIQLTSVPADTPLTASRQGSAVPETPDTGELTGSVIAADQVDNQEHTIPAAIRTVNIMDGAGGVSADTDATASDDAAVQLDVIESEATLFEQRQRIYLTGRVVTKTILDNNGNVIVEEGVRITGDIIDKVRANGRMVQLVMNNRA